jgi:hypothetical protein
VTTTPWTMTRMRVLAAVLIAAPLAAIAQVGLQPDDRGGPGYTTGTTMGREGPESGTSAGSLPRDAMPGRDMPGRDQLGSGSSGRPGPNRPDAAAIPGIGTRGSGTNAGGAGTTGEVDRDAAPSER